MRQLFRRILGLPRFVIGRTDAIRIAQSAAEEASYPWIEPVLVLESLRHFEIRTNADSRGGNVLVKVEGATGRVVRLTVASR